MTNLKHFIPPLFSLRLFLCNYNNSCFILGQPTQKETG
nr:MAG TPA: hypothetical protein [Caudoviricetes sp.]